jgi:hypothetical protein
LNYFFPNVLADFNMKCPMKTLFPQKGLPTRMSRVEISAATVSHPRDFQLTLLLNYQPNQFILLFPRTTAQACPLRTMASFRQRCT